MVGLGLLLTQCNVQIGAQTGKHVLYPLQFTNCYNTEKVQAAATVNQDEQKQTPLMLTAENNTVTPFLTLSNAVLLLRITWDQKFQYSFLLLLFCFVFSSTSLLLPTRDPPPSCTHAQSCNPMDCSQPGSSVHGLFQARILEWVAISFSIQF